MDPVWDIAEELTLFMLFPDIDELLSSEALTDRKA